ncbi:Mu transposase C-terminal domain-containing protein [Jatrophihabitans fulvus]
MVADLHRRMSAALNAPAADRGHFEFGAGSTLTDGQRTFRFTGYEASDRTPVLTYVTDDTTHRVRWDEACRMLADLAPVGADPGAGPLPIHEPDWRSLPPEKQEECIALARHLRQAITGSPEGNIARARRLGRVDPRFDPVLVPHLSDRLRAKSEELTAMGVRGAAFSSLERKAHHFQRDGIIGLVDRRHGRRKDPLASIDSEVLDAIALTINRSLAQSRYTTRQLIGRARAELEAVGLIDRATNRQIQVAVGELSRGRAMHRVSRSRRTHSNRPTAAYRRLPVSRPGEIVQIDATPADAFVWFPDAGYEHAVILTAIDAYSRQILALRVVPKAITTRDTCLLLWDICKSEVRSAGWPRELQRPHGVPRLVVVDEESSKLLNERGNPGVPHIIGRKQSLRPSAVVVDHGREFDAEHFQSACTRNGIDVIFARPGQATDKGIVESWHATLNVALKTMPGYKGPNPLDHPADAESEARLTCGDLQDALWTWIITIYHERAHAGLRHPDNPRIAMSPNMAFDLFMQVGGHIEAVLDPFAPLLFLSRDERLLQDSGIRVNNRTFQSPSLFDLRERVQRGRGAAALRIPVYYDRWDMTRIYVQEPYTRSWLCVPSTSSGGAATLPFSESITRLAIERTAQGLGPTSDEDLRRCEAEILASFASGKFADRRERRMHALEQTRQAIYAHDLEGWHSDLRDLAFPPEQRFDATSSLEQLPEWSTDTDERDTSADDADLFSNDDPDDQLDGLAV